MSHYCSEAIAVAHLMFSTMVVRTGPQALNCLDTAEQALRHNINHEWIPEDQSDPCFGVKPVRKEK